MDLYYERDGRDVRNNDLTPESMFSLQMGTLQFTDKHKSSEGKAAFAHTGQERENSVLEK